MYLLSIQHCTCKTKKRHLADSYMVFLLFAFQEVICLWELKDVPILKLGNIGIPFYQFWRVAVFSCEGDVTGIDGSVADIHLKAIVFHMC
jgi:hypothetical protein